MDIDELARRHARELRTAYANRVPSAHPQGARTRGWIAVFLGFAAVIALLAPIAVLLRSGSPRQVSGTPIPSVIQTQPLSTLDVEAAMTTGPGVSSDQADGTGGSGVTELRIAGTRAAFTTEEYGSFGEFGPLLWGLVTTINGTGEIATDPMDGQVRWGPLWGGRLPDDGTEAVYGVTDLDAVDVDAIAGVIPLGQTVVLREVQWSLEELTDFKARINAGAPENGVCTTGFGPEANTIHVVSLSSEPDLAGIPPDSVTIEVVSECPAYVPGGERIP